MDTRAQLQKSRTHGIAVLVPFTREEFIRETLESIGKQSVPPAELLLLDNREPSAKQLDLQSLLVETLGTSIRWVILPSLAGGTLKTSAAVDLLLHNVAFSTYATILADDDIVDPRFVEVFLSVLDLQGMDAIVSCDLIGFTNCGSLEMTYIDVSRFCSSSRLLNRLLSGVSGMIPGGGTIFPVELARRLRVFEAPIPVVTEDQLMSTRFFRGSIPWIHIPEGLYRYRWHEARTGGGSPLEWFGLGVVRGVRIQEETSGFLRILAYIAGVQERSRAPEEVKAEFESGLSAVNPNFLNQIAGIQFIAGPLLALALVSKRLIWRLHRRTLGRR